MTKSELEARFRSLPTVRVTSAAVNELMYATRSAEETVAQFQGNARRRQAEEQFSPHRDVLIMGVKWGLNAVRFELADQTTLSIVLRDGHMHWKFAGASECVPNLEDDFGPTVKLLWMVKKTLWLWERARLLEERVGRSAFNLSAGMVNLYLYCEGLPILRFGPVANVDTGIEFLFWCETD